MNLSAGAERKGSVDVRQYGLSSVYELSRSTTYHSPSTPKPASDALLSWITYLTLLPSAGAESFTFSVFPVASVVTVAASAPA